MTNFAQRGIPCATVGINNSTNAALLALRILATSDPRLRIALDNDARKMEEDVLKIASNLEQQGWQDM